MRNLLDSPPAIGDRWLVFDTVAGRDAAVRYFRRRRWYVVDFADVQGPALHAARVHFTGSDRASDRRRVVGV